jgi:hypothetical protein
MSVHDPDLIRWIIICLCVGIIITIVKLVWEERARSIVIPPGALRMFSLGVCSFLGAVIYALLRTIGEPGEEPLSLVSAFAVIGLVLFLGGLVWIMLDQRAVSVEPDAVVNGGLTSPHEGGSK